MLAAAQFDEWFNLEGTEAQPADVLAQLHKILRPFLLRRLKAEVEKDLPAKKEIKLLIGMSEMQTVWYASVLSKNIDVLNAMMVRSRDAPRTPREPRRIAPLSARNHGARGPTRSHAQPAPPPPLATGRLAHADAQHPYAAAQVRQPPVPLRGRRGSGT